MVSGVVPFNNNEVEYTNVSRLNRLRLEDSFLPGALQKRCIVTFHNTSYFHSRTRDVSHTEAHHQYLPQLSRASIPLLNLTKFGRM
jgi:hypothetical protein